MPHSSHRSARCRLLCTTLLSAIVSSVSAQDTNTLDCSSSVPIDGSSYDLAPLSGEKVLKRTRNTPPSTMEDEFRFDVCHDLAQRQGVAEADQCPTGTRACLTKTNKKSGETDRIVAAIPIAQTSVLQPAYSALQSPSGLSILLHGGSYPSDASPPSPQSLNLTLLCVKDGSSDPTFMGYENGIVSVQWNTSAGCSAKRDDNSNDGNNNSGSGEDGGKETRRSGGSGIGWFFLLLFVSFLGYLALGAYYNYNHFGASGWDLVPHRDFWRDVPYLLRDLTDHLCSTLRPGHTGASRRGYMAV